MAHPNAEMDTTSENSESDESSPKIQLRSSAKPKVQSKPSNSKTKSNSKNTSKSSKPATPTYTTSTTVTAETSQEQDESDTNNISSLLKKLLQADEFKKILQKCVSDIVSSAIIEVKDKLAKHIREAECRIDQQDSAIFNLQTNLDNKEAEVRELREKFTTMDDTITTMQRNIDDLQQYSRRNSIRLHGITEGTNEDTDDLVINAITTQLKCTLTKDDIDRSHRTGKAREADPESKKPPKPRPILIKFCSYRKKAEIMKLKRNLKNSGISVNEDLTRRNHSLLIAASKSPKVEAAWSSDGRILAAVKTTKEGKTMKKLITTMTQIAAL